MTESENNNVVGKAREYYNSGDADRFYFQIWGGEDIHIGLYEGPEHSIAAAGEVTVARMIGKLPPEINESARVLDIGAGYGGSARQFVKARGGKLTCLNLSEVQNERNRRKNEERGLAEAIEVVDGNFEDLPFEADAFDVVWCQDSILHSGNREKVFQEVDRVLKPGGHFIFTDIMQKAGVDPNELRDVYNRIHLDSLGSIEEFREYGEKLGWQFVEFEDHSHQLPEHYQRVHDELTQRRERLKGQISEDYVDRMLNGLRHWVAAGRAGNLRWGIVHFHKP